MMPAATLKTADFVLHKSFNRVVKRDCRGLNRFINQPDNEEIYKGVVLCYLRMDDVKLKNKDHLRPESLYPDPVTISTDPLTWLISSLYHFADFSFC